MTDRAIAKDPDVAADWDCPDQLKPSLVNQVISYGDDALVLGHRLSEWCGHGPLLEEDIALANIALDLIGRASAALSVAGDLEGAGRSADDLAYFREAVDFRNAALVEFPRGDFAYTIARQFFFDVFALDLNDWLASNPGPLRGIAGKAVKETSYHLRHTSEWMKRLGDGTEESHDRVQSAVNELWMYTGELFEADANGTALTEAGLLPDRHDLKAQWDDRVGAVLAEAGITTPETDYHFSGARSGRHTEHLGHMLSEMQILARSHPGAEW